ncbi:YhdP family protein [Luteimonas sp. R10]|uniref:YhdP family protein n=1 Tax=Luteimonas sp. R10 TaxID=3108176 RepID=UPI0030938E71|nr:YhdP family protein [Luteimonas sp. R10]
MSLLRHRLRLLRRGLWLALAVVLVLMALAAGITSQMLPLVERHPQRVADWLSARAGREVAFDRLETEWTRRGPLLRLDGLRIGEGPDAVQVGAAEVLVAQYAGLLPGGSLTELRLRELDLTLERDDDGRWRVRGLPGQRDRDGDGDPFAALERLGELQVIGGSLTVHAPGLDIEATVPRIDLRLRVDGDRVRAAARAWMEDAAPPLQAALEFTRDRGDGRAYAALRAADLAHWSPLLRHAGIVVERGHGRVDAWATLRDNRVAAVVADTVLDDLGLAASHDGDAKAAPVAFGRVEARLRWAGTDRGWRLDAPRLRVTSGDAVHSLDGLLVAAGERYALAAEHIDAGPLLALLSLSDGVPPALRGWLRQAQPDAVLGDVEVAGERGGALRVQARIEDLAFASVGDRPGMSGLRGSLHGDARGIGFTFDPEAELRFDWPAGFGDPHRVSLRGDVVAWRDGDAWSVQAPALRIDGDGYGADVRGGLRFAAGGGRPWMDLAARLDDTQVPVAKRFWVRHRMPAATVAWLDGALVAGTVRNGRALVSGDLDDWPFRSVGGRPAPGLFHAEADLAGAEVKFQPDWPAAEGLTGRLRFIAEGFDLRGGGTIAGVAFDDLEAGIARFGRAELGVSARTRTDAGALLALLRASPLQAMHGDALDDLAVAGPVAADFAMVLPMHGSDRGRPRIDGGVELQGVRAREPEWDLALDDVRGDASYDEKGFIAGQLHALHEDHAGVLALRAGDGHVRDPAQAFEAELRMAIDAAQLLARAPDLDWLRPHVRGRSDWTVAVSVPASGPPSRPQQRAPDGAQATAAARLRLRSDLVGTVLDLPAPLDKPVAAPLPSLIEIALPMERGEISVRLGQRMALRARSGGGRTGVDVALGGSAAAAPPASGLVVSGHTPALAAMDWIGLAGGGGDEGEGGGEGLSLQRIDVAVDRLSLLGGTFADTRVRGARAEDGGTSLRFSGPALAGSLSVPRASGGSVRGRLQRLHWRSATVDAEASASTDTAGRAPPAGGTDPADIPPIDLAVDDLRLNDAKLGEASLRTRPVPGGLRIEQLQTRAPKQRVDATGDWRGRGADERTRLAFDIASRDFGALLAGLGQGGRILGGDGSVQLDAAWPGSPARFRADALQGTLALRVKDGQLVEIDPGAGRVLGLLSVAELPRRLTLDFRDFFDEGFAFNRIGGQVRFGQGRASSDDLVIDGPAAEIRIAGSADLRAQTYDQTIDVLPKSANLLTAVGAIAGGPFGAAVGAVANAVLRRPLGELGATTYHVSGPWKEPKVEVVRREPRVAERERPPRGD